MLQKLKKLLVVIGLLSLVFIISLISYVSAYAHLMDYEKSKNSLLTFMDSYEHVFDNSIHAGETYLSTGNAAEKYRFTSYVNNLISCNKINADSIRFSDSPEIGGFKTPVDYGAASDDSSQNFSFDKKEQELYLKYLTSCNSLLDSAITAVDGNDVSALHSREFTDLQSEADSLNVECTTHFMERINQQQQQLSDFIGMLTLVLILTGILLLFSIFSACAFYSKNNRHNLYFHQIYSKAIENADVGMAILDKNYRYEYLNSTYKKLFGIEHLNPLGENMFAVLPEEVSAAIPSHTFAEIQKNLTFTFNHEEEVKYVSYSCFTIFDHRDNPKFVTLIQDCTQSNKKDEELQNLIEETKFFANAKSSFVANVSHEIKTPLNAIIGMVHILRSTSLSQEQIEAVSKLHTSSELLLNIINDVLDISKIQKSSFVLYPSDFNLLTMLEESEEIFSPLIHNKGLQYIKEFNFEPDLCLSLDKTRLAQVLLNLVNNATKFTISGHIKLSINQISDRDDLILLKFVIEDTGMGIDEENLYKVFQEFEQLENHLTKQHQGTGLGLAICKHVVNAMGGDIWVESKKGEGSQFIFTIWARKIDPELCAVSAANGNSVMLLDGEGQRVLVVEDTELNYEVTEHMLGESGIICDHARDGQEAIDMCIKVPDDYYKIILMDIHMPNMDGYSAAEILRTEIGTTCPIIALTATNIDDSTRERYKDIIDDFISKPFRYQEFHKALIPYFGLRDGGDNAAASQEQPAQTKGDVSSDKSLSDESDLPGLPNFDLLSASQKLGCSEKQYIKHFNRFKSSYSHADSDIEELLQDKNYNEAHRIAHSVKGLAGMLILNELYKAAEQLEKAILENPEEAGHLIPDFKKELALVCKNNA